MPRLSTTVEGECTIPFHPRIFRYVPCVEKARSGGAACAFPGYYILLEVAFHLDDSQGKPVVQIASCRDSLHTVRTTALSLSFFISTCFPMKYATILSTTMFPSPLPLSDTLSKERQIEAAPHNKVSRAVRIVIRIRRLINPRGPKGRAALPVPVSVLGFWQSKLKSRGAWKRKSAHPSEPQPPLIPFSITMSTGDNGMVMLSSEAATQAVRFLTTPGNRLATHTTSFSGITHHKIDAFVTPRLARARGLKEE